MTPTKHDPHQLQKLLSRRTFLSVSGVGAATALGLTLESASASQPPKRTAAAVVKTASGDAGYHQPFALDTSCVLSEDHFQIKVGKIDPAKDTVVAYSRTDGQVEALLLQDGTISQVYRDPATAGGWNIREIAAGATDMVAGMASDKDKNLHLHVFYRTTANQVKHLQEDPPSADGISSGQFTTVETLDWNASGRLQITTDVLRNLLVFSFEPSSSAGKTDARLRYYWTANGFHGLSGKPWDPFTGTLSGFAFTKTSDQTRASAAISFDLVTSARLYLFVPDTPQATVRVYGHPLLVNDHSTAGGNVTVFPANQPPSFAPVSIVSVDHLNTNKFESVPTAVVRSADQQLYTLSENVQESTGWHWQQLVMPTGIDHKTALVWEPSSVDQNNNDSWSTSSNVLNLFVVADQTLSVIRQVNQGDALKDAATPVFNPAMPLQNDVAIAASQARPSAGDELIVVDADGNLEMLTKAASGAWTANQIHLPADETAEVSTYRVQLTLSDTWGTRVANRDLHVISSAPAIALVNGRGVTLSAAPASFTTDLSGQVTIPIVAEGLAAPMLTVSTDGLSAAVKASPSSPVNDYMTGAITLNYLPAVDGNTLAHASTPAGATVFPVARQHEDDAAQAAIVLAAAATAATNPTTVSSDALTVYHGNGLNGNGLAGIESAGHRPGLSQRQVNLGSSPALGEAMFRIDGVELSFGDLTNDALYAVKKGAAKVSQVVVSVDKSINRWVGTITADFGAWEHQLLTITIHDLQDAAHIFHSVVNYLGAVLTDVIDWLKAHVLKLLADTVTLAARYDGWLLQVSDELYTLTQKAKGGADKFLQGTESEIQAALAKLRAQLGSQTISSFTSPHDSGAMSRTSAEQTPQPPTSADSNWLLEKVSQSGVAAAGTPSVDDALAKALKDVETTVASVGQDFTRAANDFRDSLASLVSNPKNFGAVGIDKLIDAFGDLIKAALDAAEGLIDLVLDLIGAAIALFRSILTTPVSDLPLIEPLLKAAGMDKPLTIGRLVTLVVAFPTALGYKLRHLDADALPFKNVGNTSVQQVAGTSDDLSYSTFAAASFWGLIDTIAAYMVAFGSEPPALFAWIDIAAPTVISALTFPAHDDGLPFSSPIKLDDDGDVYTAVAWGAGALPAVFSAIMYWGGEATSESMLCLTSMTGALAAAFGVVAALATSSSPVDAADPAALAVLGNTAAGLAYGLEKEVVASTYGASAVVAGTMGGVCTFAASAIDSFGDE